MSITCPYCNAPARLRSAAEVYRGGLAHKKVWVCTNYPTCDAFVGCHETTNRPLGSLANKPLRLLRQACHSKLDPLWQSAEFARKDLYSLAATFFHKRAFHIAEFRDADCKDFLDRFDAFVEFARNLQSQTPDERLVTCLQYLFVGMQQRAKTCLPLESYRGHRANLESGVRAGLLLRIKKKRHTYYSLTHAGRLAILCNR